MAAYSSKKPRAKKKSTSVKKRRARLKKAAEPLTRKRGVASKIAPRKKAALKRKGTRRASRGQKTTGRKTTAKMSPARGRSAKKAASTAATKRKRSTATSQKSGKRSQPQAASKRTRKQTPKAKAKTTGQKRARARQKALDALKKKKDARRRTKKRRPKKKTVNREEARIQKQAVTQATKGVTKPSRAELWQRVKARFDYLMGVAAKKKQLPNLDYRASTKMNSRQNVGQVKLVHIEETVEDGTVEGIMYKIRQAAKRFKRRYGIWNIVFIFSAMGERLVGSGQQILDAKDEDAPLFQTQAYDQTGLHISEQAVMMAAEDILIDLASEPRTIVYCHAARVMNFDRKREMSS